MASRNPAHLRAPALALAATLGLCGPAQARGLFDAKPPAPAASADAGKSPAPARTKKADAAIRAAAERLEPLARAAFWAREQNIDPADVEASVKLAASLRTLGRFDEASISADKALVIAPGNEEALLEAGRDRLAADQGFYAVSFLQRAQAAAPKDWRPASLLGVAFGQTKRTAESRAAYAQALQLSPENPAVLSNMAMTAAAAGDTQQAEGLLRRAVARPQATATERQNLALVLGLEGKLAEAESLIRRDLPPDAADANLAYLQAADTAAR